MDIAHNFLGLKTLIASASMHIKTPEMAVFGLFFLVFVLVFFFLLIFWRYRLVFMLCVMLELCIVFITPFGVAFVMRHFLYPIKVSYTHFAPFVYTSGFSFDLTIRNLSKLEMKECMLTITPLRENPKQSVLITLQDTLLPLNAYTQVLSQPIKPKQSVRWSGIIDNYRYGERYSSVLDCH